MSGFSSPEFLLIVVLALVVLGPKRLPEIANKIGSWVGQARRMTRVMKRQLEEELNVDDLNQIASPRATRTPSPGARAAASTAEVTEGDAVDQLHREARIKDTPSPEHIPNDDDTFSPAHAEEDTEKSA